MAYQENTGYELDWNSPIENDSPELVLLPEGDYSFRVLDFERARHTPGKDGKLPPCNKAVLQVKVTAPEGETTIKHNLFLHSTTEGILCAFFTAIGQRQHGEKVIMNWNAVKGATGRCKVGIREWIGNNGEKRQSNEIKRFLEPEEGTAAKTAGFQAGRF